MKRYLHRGAGRHEIDMPSDVVAALEAYLFGPQGLADVVDRPGEAWDERAVRRRASAVLRGALGALWHGEEVDTVPVFQPHVVQVYAWDAAAWPAYDCKRCSSPIPAHMAGERLTDDVESLWFDRYPICRATVPDSDQ